MKHVLEISLIEKSKKVLLIFLYKQPGCYGLRLRFHEKLSNWLATTHVENLKLGNWGPNVVVFDK